VDEIATGGFTMKEIERLLELAKELPPMLQSDWKDTQHFELQSLHKDEEYFWLSLADFWHPNVWEHPSYLRRIGLLMDIAEALKKAEPMLQKLSDQS